MKTLALFLVPGAVLVVAVAFLLLSREQPSGSRRIPVVVDNQASSEASADANLTPGGKARIQGNSLSHASGQVLATENEFDRDQLDAIKELLSQPVRRGVPLGDVPEMTPGMERRLIFAYGQTTNLVEKVNLWQILAMRGGIESFRVLTNAFLTEFNGEILDDDVAARLQAIPYFLGLMSQREPSVQRFLLQGTNPDYWDQNATLYEIGTDSRIAASTCVVGLMAFNRSEEIDELKQFFRDNPEIVAKRRLRSAVLDGLFEATMVDSFGLPKAYDEVLHQPLARDGSWLTYYAWRKNSQVYRAWADWQSQVQRLEIEEGKD